MTPRATGTSVVALWVLTALATAMFLRTARDLLIPITIAVLVSYALDPVVVRLEHLRIPRLVGAALLLLILTAGAAFCVYGLDSHSRPTRIPEAPIRGISASSSTLAHA